MKFLNKFILQWLFIRLTKCTIKKIVNFNLLSYDIVLEGICARGTGNAIDVYWYSIQYWILPFTGWNTDFIYLNKKPKFLRITNYRATN